MNKEIAKRNLPPIPDATKPKSKPINWKTLTKALIFIILIFEAAKSIILARNKGYNILFLALGLTGSVLLTIIYFLLSLCIPKTPDPKSKGLKEFILIAAMLLFLFSIQKALIDTQLDQTDFLTHCVSFVSMSGILVAFLFIQDLLKTSIFSNMILISFFFLFVCLEAISRIELNVSSTYFNTIGPLVYLIPLMLLKRKIHQQKMESPFGFQAQTGLNCIKFIKESIFTYDKKGRLELQNDFIFKENKEEIPLAASDIFRKIREVTLLSEEKIMDKLSNDESNQNLMGINSDSNLYSQRAKDMNPIVINLEDPLSPDSPGQKSSLDTATKSLYLAVNKKQITEKKMMMYQGVFQNEKKKTYNVEIRVYIIPNSSYPLIVILKDITTTFQLEEVNARDRCREVMFVNLANQINVVMENSKKILEMSLQNLKKNHSLEEIKTNFIASTQQILTPIIVTIGDIVDFCSSKRTKLKFVYAPCDLRKAIQKTLKLFQFEIKAKKLEVICDSSTDLQNQYLIHTDEKRLVQLLTRLLSNSIKHTKNGNIKIFAKAYTNTFKITVEDTGSGIPPDTLEKINEELKLYQPDSIKLLHTKAGKSQGLPIAQMLALSLGPKTMGGLNIKSDGSSGTSVWFIVENKAGPDEVVTGKGTEAQPVVINYHSQRNAYSPAIPSRFKMTHEYEGPESYSTFGDVAESVEVNNPIHHNLESRFFRKSPENTSRRTSPLSRHSSKTSEFKKSIFAQNEAKYKEEVEAPYES